MSAVPINSTNAIDAAAFAVVFDRSFTDQEQNKFLVLQKTFEKELPNFSRGAVFGAKFENNKIINQESKEVGVKLQRIEPNGKVGWSLHVMEDQIVISCNAYDRWSKVWGKVDKYLKSTVDLLNLDTISVSAIVLQYVDRFTENSNVKYSAHNVFDDKTKFLTPHSCDVGKLWHVHQGWFEDKAEKEKILHVLNLGTTEDSKKILTTINHSLQLQFLDESKPAKKIFNSKNEYQKTFVDLHEKNKKILRELLNSKQLKAIDLT